MQKPKEYTHYQHVCIKCGYTFDNLMFLKWEHNSTGAHDFLFPQCGEVLTSDQMGGAISNLSFYRKTYSYTAPETEPVHYAYTFAPEIYTPVGLPTPKPMN